MPVDVSVNATACPAAGEAGVYVKEAAKAAPTVTVRVSEFCPDVFITVSVTLYVPAAAKAWLGFWDVEVAPSPKAHCQIDGLPVDVSVNWTVWPVAGEAGL